MEDGWMVSTFPGGMVFMWASWTLRGGYAGIGLCSTLNPPNTRMLLDWDGPQWPTKRRRLPRRIGR